MSASIGSIDRSTHKLLVTEGQIITSLDAHMQKSIADGGPNTVLQNSHLNLLNRKESREFLVLLYFYKQMAMYKFD